MSRRRPVLRTAAVLVASLLGAAAVAPSAVASAVPVPVPSNGSAYYGVNLDWNLDSPKAYAARTGVTPAQYGAFAHLPLTSTDKAALAVNVDAVAAVGGRLFLTLEPSTLSGVTDTAVAELTSTLAAWNARGVGVLLRFAHEMNGSWYPWGQQPTAYKAAFAKVASAVHAAAPGTAMVWAPNYGGGYPYAGGAYSAQAGTADFAALDTDGSRTLSMNDDVYGPYYPGDEHVDWVGLTMYHFGHAWPYGENEVPEAGKFVQALRGAYTGNGRYEDQSAVGDFYGTFAEGKGKPMAIAETAALYNEAQAGVGASEVDIKTAWVDQVYSPATRAALPGLKLVNWFEIRKFEGEANGTVDWRSTFSAPVLGRLQQHLAVGGYVYAGGTSTAPPAPTTTVPGVPTSLSGSGGPGKVTVSWRPPISNGGTTVTSYEVCANGTSCRSVSATTTSTTVDRLARRTSYTVTVAAVNAQGKGSPASIVLTSK